MNSVINFTVSDRPIIISGSTWIVIDRHTNKLLNVPCTCVCPCTIPSIQLVIALIISFSCEVSADLRVRT